MCIARVFSGSLAVFSKRLTGAGRFFQDGMGPASFNRNCKDIPPSYVSRSGSHTAAAVFVVFEIGLKYCRRLDIKGVLATILPKLTKRMRTYVIYLLDLLLLCSSALFYDPIELHPEEGFTKQRASIDVCHLNVTSLVVILGRCIASWGQA